MANDLNRCEFIGRLGKDPDVRQTQSGEAIANFSLACGWKGKNGEGTEWVPVSTFGKLAEVCSQYLKKGSQVYIAGRFRTRKYQDRDGNDRYVTEIVASDMQMLGGKSDGQRQERPAQTQQSQGGVPYDDDIPFAAMPNTW